MCLGQGKCSHASAFLDTGCSYGLRPSHLRRDVSSFWSPGRIWSPGRNPIGHGTCPMHPMGVDPTMRVGCTPCTKLLIPTVVFTPSPYGPECPPSLNAPPRTPTPWRFMRVARHGESAHAPSVASHVGVVPPAGIQPAAHVAHLCTGSGAARGHARVLVDHRVEVVAFGVCGLCSRSYYDRTI